MAARIPLYTDAEMTLASMEAWAPLLGALHPAAFQASVEALREEVAEIRRAREAQTLAELRAAESAGVQLFRD
jgi:hypothetical protein